jgi:predicted amidohydrolase YtcJ
MLICESCNNKCAMNPQMMKQLISFFSLSLLSILGLNAQNQTDTLIYKAEKIYTADTGFSVATSMVVSNGVILYIGSDKTADSLFPKARTINYGNNIIYPGFIDAHCHFLAYTKGLSQADLVATKSEQEVIKRLKKYVKKNKARFRNIDSNPKPWIVGRGWDQNDWENKEFPNMDALNKAFPNLPVCLSRIDGHAVWINQAAINTLRLNPDTLVEGGEFIFSKPIPTADLMNSAKNPNPGTFNGICIDNAAEIVKNQIPDVPYSVWQPFLKTGLKNCHSQGLTQLVEAGIKVEDITMIQDLQSKKELSMRIYAMLACSEENLSYVSRNGMIFDDMLTVRSMKFYLDGALGSRGALLKGDYCDQLGHKGLQLMTIPKFEMYQVYLLNKGFQVCVHAIGDSANTIALNTFNKNIPEGYDARWRIEHAQIVSGKDQKLFSKRSIIPSVQPTHATSDAAWADSRLCNTINKGGYAYQNLLRQSKIIALGTDFPVEGISPIHTFYSATQRMDAGGKLEKPFIGEQALSRKQALWGMTLWAAYANFDETRTGSLETGKLADFVVLNTDIMTAEPSKILKTKVKATFLGGAAVFSR